ncbi:TonB-dependent receptor [Magnetococcales bacterium HHB-1]
MILSDHSHRKLNLLKKRNRKILTAITITSITGYLSINPLFAEEQTTYKKMEEVSVTATRVARSVTDIPETVAVISKEQINNAKMHNIKEALEGVPGVLIDSKNGGYDARLVIRGAGQKAPYGVREITILRDGVPMTDPDSFSRLDFIDTQDIERIEVTKGPGSLYSAGSAGGTIQIVSKSVFDTDANRFSIADGEEGAESYHLRLGDWITDNQAITLTASRRVLDNHWRRWNSFDTSQISLKHGIMFGEDSTLETELSYSEANLKLPNSMSEDQFETFKQTGRQEATQDAWKHSGRYSKIWFFNSKFEKKSGNFTYKPRLYFNHWSHYHPVTGAINDSPNNLVFGTDLELSHQHNLFGKEGALVAGITLRQDRTKGAKKYEYNSVSTIPSGRIIATLSDAPGDLLESKDSVNTLYGFFWQESMQPVEKLTVDLGMRFDKSHFEIDANEINTYSYATGQYTTGEGISHTEKSFTLLSAKLGASYALDKNFNIFGHIAQSEQVPSSSEIQDNTSLESAVSRNFEIGLKGRHKNWNMDFSVYYNPVENEVVSTLDDNGDTVYQNAGKTDKKGLELSLGYQFPMGIDIGANYAYSAYKFDNFQEVVSGVVTDRSGNFLPFVPPHQGSLFINYNHPSSGFKARIQSNFWDKYHIDNANSDKYEGYDFLTNMMLGYQKDGHQFMLNANNLFDLRYAAEVKKSTSGSTKYYAGAPRSVMFTYRYAFSGSDFFPFNDRSDR